jgi:hypothetical protein
MEDIWGIISGWHPVGQGVFFLVVFGIACAVIDRLGYYITVACRGWPPEHCVPTEED